MGSTQKFRLSQPFSLNTMRRKRKPRVRFLRSREIRTNLAKLITMILNGNILREMAIFGLTK